MTRDYLYEAFMAEKRERALRGRRVRPFRQARKFPLWLSYAPTRPVGRRERAAADDPWTGVKVLATLIAGLLLVYWLATQMPERRVPADPRGYTVSP